LSAAAFIVVSIATPLPIVTDLMSTAGHVTRFHYNSRKRRENNDKNKGAKRRIQIYKEKYMKKVLEEKNSMV
jgi:hypothetical protein